MQLMQLKLQEKTLTVIREKGDPSYPPMRPGSWGSPDSRLLYHIKQKLNAQGFNLIKKRMWKDGHLVDSDQLYLRTRNRHSPKPHICIWNSSYAIYDAARELMENGEITLSVERDIFDKDIKST
jgi:hypothetical protein